MVHPVFATLIFDGELACLNLFGVIVGIAPRATMRFAPDDPNQWIGFEKPLWHSGSSAGRCAVYVINFSRRKTSWVIVLSKMKLCSFRSGELRSRRRMWFGAQQSPRPFGLACWRAHTPPRLNVVERALRGPSLPGDRFVSPTLACRLGRTGRADA